MRGGCTASAATLAATLELTPSPAASNLDFATGMDGKLRSPAASLLASAIASAGAFATALATCPLCGIAPNRRMVANSMVHLSVARATKSPFATELNLLPKRAADTGPLATFGVVRSPGPSVYASSNSGTKSSGKSFSTSRQLATHISRPFQGSASRAPSAPNTQRPILPEAAHLKLAATFCGSAIISRIHGHLDHVA